MTTLGNCEIGSVLIESPPRNKMMIEITIASAGRWRNLENMIQGESIKLLMINRLEGLDYVERIDRMGGMVAAIEQGLPQREIAEAAYRHQVAVDAGDRLLGKLSPVLAACDDPPDPALAERFAARAASLEPEITSVVSEQLRELRPAGYRSSKGLA